MTIFLYTDKNKAFPKYDCAKQQRAHSVRDGVTKNLVPILLNVVSYPYHSLFLAHAHLLHKMFRL